MAKNGQIDIKAPTAVDPRIILADPKYNFSRFLAEEQGPNDAFVQWLAWDMHKDGNKEPVKVMRRSGDTVHQLDLVSGFNRVAAAMLIIQGFTYHNPVDGKDYEVHNPDFKLRVIVSTGNERDRARENLRENAARKDITPMDVAHQIRYCEEVLQLSVNETAEWLNLKDPSYVSQLRKLLILPRDIQVALAKGLIKPSVRVLMKLTELPPEEREPYFQEILDGNKVTLDEVRKHIVERHAEQNGDGDEGDEGDGGDGEGSTGGGSKKGAKAGPTMQVTPRILRDFYEGRVGPGEYTAISAYCEWMVGVRMKGKATDQQHENRLYKVVQSTLNDVLTHLVNEGHLEEGAVDPKAFYKLLISNQANLGDTADVSELEAATS